MQMDSDYWTPLDQEFVELVNLKPAYVGQSTHPAKDQIQELKAKIFQGTSSIELGFFGTGKGSRGQEGGQNPESYGKEEREALKQLARLNEVSLSVHAAPGAGSVTGIARGGGISAEAREDTLHEIERAISFAADVTEGGPVVFHLNEFPVPIYKRSPKLEGYPEEEKSATEYLVDKRTGEIINQVKHDKEIVTPVWRTNAKGQYIDERGNVADMDHRVPVIDKDKGVIKTSARDWNFIVKESEEWNKAHPNEARRTAAQHAFFTMVEAQSSEYLSKAKEATDKYSRMTKEREDIEAQLEQQKKLEAVTRPDLMWQHKVDFGEGVLGKEKILLSEAMKRELEQINKHIDYLKDAATSYSEALQSREEIKRNVEPLEVYGSEKASETIARAAMYAYDLEKKRGLEKPLFVAPENLWGTYYGAHPSELKEVVVKSREAMTRMLKGKGMDEDEAKGIAKDHVKATFDVGHANIWKKYFKGNDAEFNQWLIDEVEGLVKEGIIGNVHTSDNFGYEDEHLSPGQGTAPLKELFQILDKHKYPGKIIAEAGGQPAGRGWEVHPEVWRMLGTPIYRIDSVRRSWGEISEGYFGKTYSHSTVGGDYLPSEDWKTWSGVGFE